MNRINADMPNPWVLTITKVCSFFGYASISIQWLWVIILLLPSILSNQQVQSFVEPPKQSLEPLITLPKFQGSDVMITVIAITIMIVALLFTTIILIRLPMKVSSAGKQVLETSVRKAVPIFAGHKYISKEKRAAISIRVRIAIKLGLMIVPLIALPVVSLLESDLSVVVILTVGLFLAGMSLMWHSFTYIVAYVAHIPFKHIL